MVNASNWMSTPSIKAKKLHEIIMPGSHDSAAYKLSQKWTPKNTTSIGDLPMGSLTKLDVIKKWTITQDFTIEQQLEHGIRLLDFRISYVDNWFSKDGFALTHTFGCCGYEEGLEQVKSFLKKNPTEVVVITAEHDYAHRKGMTPYEDELIDLTKDKFNGMLVPVKDYKTKTVDQLAGKVVFVYDVFTRDKDGLIKSPDIYDSYWPNSQSVSETDSKVKQRIEDQTKRAPDFISYTITADGNFIAKNLLSSLKAQTAKLQEPFKEFIKYIAAKKEAGDYDYNHLNGIHLDFPTDEMIEGIINLNGNILD
jgi:hypothetical protein